jgi:hypothetical protein
MGVRLCKAVYGNFIYKLKFIIDYMKVVGASTSHDPVGLCGLLQGYLYLYIYMKVGIA